MNQIRPEARIEQQLAARKHVVSEVENDLRAQLGLMREVAIMGYGALVATCSGRSNPATCRDWSCHRGTAAEKAKVTRA